jgi:uncharacterized protein (TIGR02996 family)
MHPDEAAFLAAINGGDDQARLVFADWLEERGDPRGPWVRDPELWAVMAPDAGDPVPRLLAGQEYGRIPQRNWDLLGRIGPSAVPALAAALRDESGHVRRQAARVLQTIGPGAVAAVPTLIAALQDDIAEVRVNAETALGKIGAGAVEALSTALQDHNANVRRGAAWALDGIGRNAVKAIPTLIAALRDEYEVVRCGAASALGRIGPRATAAIPALASLRQGDPDSDVRAAAQQAIEQITRPAAP